MSVRLMGEVWSLDVDHARLLILLALADHADDRGRNIFPSQALVAWKTGYTVRRVRGIMKHLREQGALVQITRAQHHSPPHYRLDLGMLPRKPPLEREENFAPHQRSERKTQAGREENPSAREENSSIREEIAISSKSSSESSLKLSNNLGPLKKSLKEVRDKETQRIIIGQQAKMVCSGLYLSDELAKLKGMTLSQLEEVHKIKLLASAKSDSTNQDVIQHGT